jgi:hypothetical protein
MDTETLIKIVAMLNASIVEKVGIIWEDVWEDGYNDGYIDALTDLADTLESVIDANVATMKSNTGE